MARRSKLKRQRNIQISIVVILIAYIIGFMFFDNEINYFLSEGKNKIKYSYSENDIPEYNGSSFVYLNNNKSNFTNEEKNTKSFESYSDLDIMGRAGVALANIGIDLMPTTPRGSIGSVKPSGWHTIKYDNIDGLYLYNRCHLIGYQLTGENANTKNLITCTRAMNTGVMLEYENKVASYIKETHNHVLYRVTPIFIGDNLLATGVKMEGYSIEDNGKGIDFNIFIYNVQKGIKIDYSNGDSEKVSKK